MHNIHNFADLVFGLGKNISGQCHHIRTAEVTNQACQRLQGRGWPGGNVNDTVLVVLPERGECLLIRVDHLRGDLSRDE